MRSTILGHGDSLAMWWIEDLIELTEEQENIIEKDIDRLWKEFKCSGIFILAQDMNKIGHFKFSFKISIVEEKTLNMNSI